MLPFIYLFTGLDHLKEKERLFKAYGADMCVYTKYLLTGKYAGSCHDVDHDTEEIVSRTFFKVFTNIDLIDFERSEKEIKSYIFTILTHEVCDFYKGRETVISMEEHLIVPVSDENIFEDIAVREENKTVKRALNNLPEPYRSTMALRYIDKLSVMDIAKLLNKSKSTIYSWIEIGKEKLIVLLKEEGIIVDEYFKCKK